MPEFQAVNHDDTNFQGLAGRFGGRSEVLVVDGNEILRLAGTDNHEAAKAVAAVLNTSLVAPEIGELNHHGLPANGLAANVLARALSFADEIKGIPTNTEQPVDVIDLREEGLPRIKVLPLSSLTMHPPEGSSTGTSVTVDGSGVLVGVNKNTSPTP